MSRLRKQMLKLMVIWLVMWPWNRNLFSFKIKFLLLIHLVLMIQLKYMLKIHGETRYQYVPQMLWGNISSILNELVMFLCFIFSWFYYPLFFSFLFHNPLPLPLPLSLSLSPSLTLSHPLSPSLSLSLLLLWPFLQEKLQEALRDTRRSLLLLFKDKMWRTSVPLFFIWYIYFVSEL